MHRLDFQASRTLGMNVYRYIPGTESAVTRHWPGLFQEWSQGPTPFTEYAVNNNNMEEMAVYLGLAWRLTAGLARYAIPTYYRDDAAEALGREPVMVDWEYEIEAEDPHTVLDNGFVPGRSTADGHTPKSWENANRAGLFELSAPRDLVRLLRAVLLDATAEISLFGVAPGADRQTDLVASLCDSARPSLPSVLRDEDVFVDLTIGSDVGYYDAITVASPTDLQLRIDALAIDYATRIEAYQNSLDDLSDMTAFLRAIRELAGITLDAA
ncbi:hypothetical protein OG895_27515 [Streptomyces sp. NBC_00201]|uniref:hypothetical protein n=1 Tax=Streptomyces sp. NBC_00201 TaxID=2975679 RepID=UPI0022571BA7|nr:hypothetical protein [Streptomyces sp. NBC_00201]MCX5248925.1 hypothetical protein [Streptomyces sp. NBC_00201]